MNNCFLLPRIWSFCFGFKIDSCFNCYGKQLKQDKLTTNLTRLRKIFPPLLPQQEHGDKGDTAHEMYHKATLAFDDVVPQPPNRDYMPSLVFLIPYKFTPLLHHFYGRQTVLLVNSVKFCFFSSQFTKELHFKLNMSSMQNPRNKSMSISWDHIQDMLEDLYLRMFLFFHI